jgi:ATP-dependent DNA helicase RecG
MIEGSKLEFKQGYTDDLKKSVVAFANSTGGAVYVGRDDAGNAYPIDDIDGTATRISNCVRDGILPDVTMFISYDINEEGIVVTVGEGTNKPYYLKEKGLRPSGVYVRQGASSSPASYEQIREMIKLTDGDKYESARSLVQKLTFQATEEEFSRRGVEFGEGQKRTLGIVGTDGLHTNLGLLLSDQFTHSIKIAVFKGTKKGEFKTRKEFNGPLFHQIRSAFDFLRISNNLEATFSGLDRLEQYDYPEEALREAMINAVVHRDYALSGSIIVNIYDDRMEFVSLGGLVPGLYKDDLFLGISQPRNERLADVFYRLRYIEAYGTGLRRIMQHYEGFGTKPVIEATHGAFSITLPNMNHIGLQVEATRLKPQHQALLAYTRENGAVTNDDVQKLLNVKQTRAYAVIKEMVKNGILIKRSSARGENEYVLNGS